MLTCLMGGNHGFAKESLHSYAAWVEGAETEGLGTPGL